ncbi:MAG: hypothetical protein IKF36_01310 [Bacilli bacterium]|nr:hypothetical protein [Bacilli bacterium]
MEKILFLNKEELTKEKEDALYLYNYLLENGFNPNQEILELSSPVSKSLVSIIGHGFLLSDKVKSDDILESGIKGAYGYYSETGIYIPKTIVNDSIFYDKYRDKVLAYFPGYHVPAIDDFDTIISASVSDDLYRTAKLEQDKYFGFCKDQSKLASKMLKYYEHLLEYINLVNYDSYEIKHDTIQEKGKELCLIKKKM